MDELIAMGFDKASAEAVLRRTGGNLDQAVDILLSGPVVGESANTTPVHVETSVGSGVLISLGVSQYTYGESGASACTVISGAMLKLLLERLKAGELVTDVAELSGIVWSGVAYYQSLPPNMHNHLAIDELGPFMTEKLNSIASLQGLLSTSNHFEDLFAQARSCADTSQHIGIVITKPPETVCVILPHATCAIGVRKYILFDSHSRPHLGLSGSYLFMTDNERELVRRLDILFPSLPMERGGTADYTQQMYNMFEGSVFQFK